MRHYHGSLLASGASEYDVTKAREEFGRTRLRARKKLRRSLVAAAVHRRQAAGLTEAEFKLRYRLDYDAFHKLLHLLIADLQVGDEKKAKNAKGGQLVLPEVKLCIALRYFAGGSPLDLRLIYHVSKSYVYDCVWLVVDAVHKRLLLGTPALDLSFQVTENGFRVLATLPTLH